MSNIPDVINDTVAFWASPEGEVFPAEAWNHYIAAREIMQAKYPDRPMMEINDFLYGKGWMKSGSAGAPEFMVDDEQRLTIAQVQVSQATIAKVKAAGLAHQAKKFEDSLMEILVRGIKEV